MRYAFGFMFMHTSHRPFVGILAVLVLLAVLAFEIVMLVSVIQNKNISQTARLWWIVGMLLIHPFVAIVYFVTDYRKA